MITSDDTIIHNLGSSPSGLPLPKVVLILVVVAILGTAAGFGITKLGGTKTSSETANVAKTAGIADKKTFKDKAEGILKEGGLDGEGNFHLERPGGASQNVYLTSSTVDLSKYIGRKVRVWGETFQAEKAGWLMDVGLVEVL